MVEIPGAEHRCLPAGIHAATLMEVREAFVTPFPSSRSREAIWSGWLSFRAAVHGLVPVRREHIDGSFLSDKVDPSDLDTILWVSMIDLTLATPDRQTQLIELSRQAKPLFKCDAYVLIEDCPASSPAHAQNEADRELLERYWQTPRDKNQVPITTGPRKGYLEVSAP